MHPILHAKGRVVARSGWLIPFAAMAGLSATLQQSGAASASPRQPRMEEPLVIPGISAPEAPQAGRFQPVPVAPRPVQLATSNLGGGFIELMLGGGNTGVRYNEPQSPHAPVSQASPGQPRQVRREIDPMYSRQEVDYYGNEAPGTLVVDTPNKFLYHIGGNGRATRYGIGVGRPGFEWSGIKTVSRKAEWPSWTPPAEMLLRRPDLPTFMEGGPGNPLGARAMYLGSSLYRIHGTNEPWSIGTNVSSGCIRMMNEDVIDLYDKVRVGGKVIVM